MNDKAKEFWHWFWAGCPTKLYHCSKCVKLTSALKKYKGITVNDGTGEMISVARQTLKDLGEL